MPSILNRLQSGWNAFLGRDPTTIRSHEDIGYGLSYRPDKARLFRTNDRSIISAVICRIGIDAAAVDLKHVRLEEDRYVETIKNCLKSGGIWTNIGPLLWHFENNAPGSFGDDTKRPLNVKTTGKCTRPILTCLRGEAMVALE